MDTPTELKIPTLVNRALNLAEQMEFTGECSHEVGRLLQVFVGHIQSGVVGELCAGCGVGTSWIASALKPTTSFVTIEENESHAAAVKRLVEPYLNIRVITGQWRTLLKEWKFSLLFASTYSERKAAQAYLLNALVPGGLIILDGLPPRGKLSLGDSPTTAQLRDYWLNEPRVYSVEVQVSQRESVILATRRG